jgi:apolipoprotein D and lipocalin family protein
MKHLTLSTLLTLAPLAMASDTPPAPVTTVAQVDLSRYLGLWHEAARLPMFFQKQCVSDVTAQYAALDNGKISVTNRCRTKDGTFDEAQGKASVVANSGNARLKVSFFWPFSGDYWIIGLDPDYRWAVVGEPKRKSLWILSRANPMAAGDLAAAKKLAQEQGYNLQTLITAGAAPALPASN